MKLRRYVDDKGAPIGWSHWCPGCKQVHVFNVERPTRAYPEFEIAGGHSWVFSGNMERPSFRPSMHITGGGWKRPDGKVVPKRTICHYHLVKGRIQFLGDSSHALKGQTVELPDIPEEVAS